MISTSPHTSRFFLPSARCLSTRAASLGNNMPCDCLKARRLSSVISQRSLSTTPSHPTRSIYSSLKVGRKEFLRFSNLPTLEKAERLICAAVSRHIGRREPVTMSELPQLWSNLLSNPPVDLRPLSEYNASAPYENFIEIFERRIRPLIKEQPLSEYSSTDFIRTCTELVWATQKPLIPLAHEGLPQEHTIPIPQKLQDNPLVQSLFNVTQEDAIGAWTLATPLIDEKTFIHEYGCWNGGNLLGLLFFGFESGIYPGGCIGTDINSAALNVAETTSELFSLPPSLVQFHLSNALYPISIDISHFRCQKQLKMALRLISVLEPSDAADFLIKAKHNMTQNCFLIVSYALPQGEKYEKNKVLTLSQEVSIRETSFEHGVIFHAPFDHPDILPQLVEFPNQTDQVINCYYTSEGFEKFIQKCGYKIVNTLTVGKHSDNNRKVVVLKIK